VRHFGQKSKFWRKIEILDKNQNLVKNQNFALQGAKPLHKIGNLFRNQNCGKKWKFW